MSCTGDIFNIQGHYIEHIYICQWSKHNHNASLLPKGGGQILPSQPHDYPGFPGDLIILSVTLDVFDIVHLVAPNRYTIWSVDMCTSCRVHGCMSCHVMYVLMLFTGSMRSLSAQQFYDEPQEYIDFMKNLNTAFTLVFTIECVLKLIAYGLRVRAWYVLMLIDTLSDSTLSFLLCCHQLSFRWWQQLLILCQTYKPDWD